jgi:transposase
MRYEPTDFEWAAVRPLLPNKPRGWRRVGVWDRMMDALAATP